MVGLKRNQQTFYYALYNSKEAVVDDWGYETGEDDITYTDPVEMTASISTATGATITEQFGTDVDYDKVILTHDLSCPIDEHSVLWVDTDTSNDFDYIVKRVAKSLNCIAYAISKVR